MRISIVLPIRNEARLLPGLLRQLRGFGSEVELIVVDGASDDDGAAVARALGCDQVLRTRAGRGQQMRAGAAVATGDAVMFLHADCRLPSAAMALVEETLDQGFDGGAFRVRHRAGSDSGALGRLCLRAADLRSRWRPLPYGDQAVFLTREAYLRVGGMPDQALMEDIELGLRLKDGGFRLRRLQAEVVASGRRFEERPLRTLLCWISFPWLRRLGVSPERLHRWYGPTARAPGAMHGTDPAGQEPGDRLDAR